MSRPRCTGWHIPFKIWTSLNLADAAQWQLYFRSQNCYAILYLKCTLLPLTPFRRGPNQDLERGWLGIDQNLWSESKRCENQRCMNSEQIGLVVPSWTKAAGEWRAGFSEQDFELPQLRTNLRSGFECICGQNGSSGYRCMRQQKSQFC